MNMVTYIKKRNFSSDMITEMTELTWKIENFRATAAQNEQKKLETTFRTGDSIGLPTRWRLFMLKVDDKLGIYFALLKSPEDVQKVWATFGYEMAGGGELQDETPQQMKVENEKGRGFSNAIKSLQQLSDQHLTNGSLMIQIKFTLLKSLETAQSKRFKFNSESLFYIREDFLTLLESGENADITIEMKDGRILKAHKLILTARSPVFSAMFQSKMQESSSGVLKIEDVSYEAMKTLLKFIYTGEVDEDWEKVVVEIVHAADKYELHLLKTFCDENLATVCTPENVWDLMRIAQLYRLKTAGIEIDSYIERNIQEVLKAKKASLAEKK